MERSKWVACQFQDMVNVLQRLEHGDFDDEIMILHFEVLFSIWEAHIKNPQDFLQSQYGKDLEDDAYKCIYLIPWVYRKGKHGEKFRQLLSTYCTSKTTFGKSDI